jgi:hypothetical protein
VGFELNGIGTDNSRNYVWDSTALTWIRMTQPGASAAGSTQVTVSSFLDSSNAAWQVADSANNALRVNVVAGAAGGSTAVTISRVQDSSNNGLAVGDSVNNAVRVNVVAGSAAGSTIVTVSSLPMVSTSAPAAGSSGLNVWMAGGNRLNIGSTASDNAVSISGNSTVIQGTNPWVIGGNSSVRANLSSTGADNPVVIISGNSSVRANLSSTAADNPVVISGNSTAIQGTSPWVVGFQAGNLSSAAQTGNSSGLTVRPVWSSSNVDQPVSAIITNMQSTSLPAAGSSGLNVWIVGGNRQNIGSTASDNAVSISGNSTVIQGSTAWVIQPGTSFQSTGEISTAGAAFNVRQAIAPLNTFASTSALASTVLSCASSVAATRFYVTAYSITSTNQTPAQWGFFSSNATLLWPMTIAALSSAVSGANLAVAPPGYLFRTAAGEALNFKTNGSTVISVQLGVSYFQAP